MTQHVTSSDGHYIDVHLFVAKHKSNATRLHSLYQSIMGIASMCSYELLGWKSSQVVDAGYSQLYWTLCSWVVMICLVKKYYTTLTRNVAVLMGIDVQSCVAEAIYFVSLPELAS